ncbi:uncharacterized protein SAPINGB_P003735 [Magnusiomyces paraingens]|uniref:J domain-containing protein n=1 Tax=Magnusiomyces paraingens TaxID=2606893 RepID=A0A5E8BT49_9ASCO|nr:uncharacterized protein SAPINGB_P003735 [Saprochaete ingens]VVT53759.1 unnamed protein product [Saprochaete ingens]
MRFNSALIVFQIFILSVLALESTTSSRSSNDLAQKISDLIKKGDTSRTLGQVNNALQSYNEAIRLDPTNYLVIFKRGVIYMNMPGKENLAIADFDSVIKLRPSFEGALKQRASIYIKLGNIDEAEKNAKLLAQSEAKKSGSSEKSESLTQYSIIVLDQISTIKNSIKAATEFSKKSEFDNCVQSATEGLKTAPFSQELLSIRINCNLFRGMSRAISRDFNNLELVITKENYYSQDALLLYYTLHESEKSITKLQKCLRFNMESKPCKDAFTDIRGFEKKFGKYAGIADQTQNNGRPKYTERDKIWKEAKAALLPAFETTIRKSVKEAYNKLGFPDNLDPNKHSKLLSNIEETICAASYYLKQFSDLEAIKYCDLIISRGSLLETLGDTQFTPSVDIQVIAHLFKVEKYLSDEAYDKANDVINNAPDTVKADNRITSKRNEIELQRTRSKNTDYYKILGVSRNADDKEIKSAYREKTKQYHPDKYRGELSPEEVDRKMAQVNQAYEVLSTPELRQRFDRGDDPNNNEANQNSQHAAQEQMQKFFRNAGGSQQFAQQFGGFDFGSFHRQRPGGGRAQGGGPTRVKFTMNHGHARQKNKPK